MKARFATVIGRRKEGSLFSKEQTCSGPWHRHDFIIKELSLDEEEPEGASLFYMACMDMGREYKCSKCGQMFTPATRGTREVRLYDTPSGEIEPGCLYFEDWMPGDFYFPSGKAPHLCAQVPDGSYWCIDSRASNCGSPCKVCRVPYRDHKDKGHEYVDSMPDHRCWVRHGDPLHPETMHVDKQGPTCDAGAGSIQTTTWHGFLHNGIWSKC